MTAKHDHAISNGWKWLYIPVTHQQRELDFSLLLAAKAASAGYSVLLGERPKVAAALAAYPPGIVLDRMLLNTKEQRAADITAMGHKIASIGEKSFALVEKDDPRRQLLVQHRLSEKTVAHVELVFTFNVAERDTLCRTFPDHAARIHATGDPRVDIWSTQYRNIYAAEAEAMKQRFGRYILFCSSCGNGSIPLKDRNSFSSLHARCDTSTPQSTAHFFRELSCDIILFEQCCTLIERIAKEFPDRTILVRPNPREQPQWWSDVLKGDNIAVCNEGQASPYILGADCLVHPGSTTGVEAYFYGIPTVAFLPKGKADRYHSNPSIRVGHSSSEPEEALELVRQALAADYTPPAGARDHAEKFFANAAGKLACDSIIEHFQSLDLARHGDPQEEGKPLTLTLKVFVAQQLERIRSLLKRPEADRAASFHQPKWPGCTLEDIDRLLAKISRHGSLPSGLEAREVGHHTYVIRSSEASAVAPD